jgi:hypothetical protein
MEKSKYQVEYVLQDLKKKGCDIKGMTIDIENAYKNERIGNKSWGKLDFLFRQGFRISGFYEHHDYMPLLEKK